MINYPERLNPGELPVAVFTDGYEWHADLASGNLRTGRDSAQRLAIIRSGKYRIWSLSWADVYERLEKPAEAQADLLASGGRLGGATSFDLLVSLLTNRRQNGMSVLARDIAMGALVGLAFLEKDEWTVVDFKTGRELETELEHYKRQVALYALSIEQATGQACARVLMKI